MPSQGRRVLEFVGFASPRGEDYPSAIPRAAIRTLSMTSCWSILIGARRIGSRRTFSRADDKRLQAITAEHFAAGYTILEARGGWFDPSIRKFVREESRQILVTSNSARAVQAWANVLGA